jgi:Carboxypeptidase regulatory-like domain
MLLLSGCGPSAEEVATMTASAWTATPPPTPTPTLTPTATPVPYDLTAKVTDEGGAPVAGADIIFPESGSSKPFVSDEAGQFEWTNLPGPQVTLKVSASGYVPAEQPAVLERGLNEVSVALARDPFGLLPSEACAPEEKLLYIDDFQDGEAQGWSEIEFRTPGWDIVPDPEVPENMIVSGQHSDMTQGDVLQSMLTGQVFDNAVWRVRFNVTKPFPRQDTWFSFNWRHAPQPFDLDGQEIFDSRYQLPFNFNSFGMRRLQQPATNIGIADARNPSYGAWHLAEISTFDGATEAWMDGQQLMAYADPKPIPPGTVSLELWLKGTDFPVYFDNMSVCELSAPFATTLYQPPTE